MATEPTIAILNAVPPDRPSAEVQRYAAVSDYWALTKPEVNFLILITTFAGFYLAPSIGASGFRTLLVIHTLLGTLLVAGGTGTLNQFLERSFDARMRRTSRRPLASGRLKASHVLWFGIALSTAGAAYLAIAVNILTSLLAIATLLSYLFLYTPLKRKTPLCTLVGAFPGAVPPLIGWAAARRLLARRIPCSSGGRVERTFCTLAELLCLAGSPPGYLDSGDLRPNGPGLRWRGTSPRIIVFLLQCALCVSQVEFRGATTACRFDYLSSLGVHPADAG